MADTLGKIFEPLTRLISGALELFHSVGAPWWLAVVLLTFMVRSALLPLTLRQVKNARAMQELRPEMEKLKELHKDDRRKQQEALMDLYKERRINPAAGFLPLLVQIPVFVTMYRVVRTHEETFPSFASGGLLWFRDLTQADPYFVLPVLSASIMVVAGEISARNVDPAQRRMMRLLPLAFTAFIARFPAGLFVYWISSNLFTLVQNLLVYRPGSRPAPTPDEPQNAQSRPGAETPTARPSAPTGSTEEAEAPKPGMAKTGGRRKKKRKKKR